MYTFTPEPIDMTLAYQDLEDARNDLQQCLKVQSTDPELIHRLRTRITRLEDMLHDNEAYVESRSAIYDLNGNPR